MPRDVPLVEQAGALAPLVADARLVLVDAGGLGLGLCEALQALRLPVRGVLILAGEECREAGRFVHAGKGWLIQRMRIALAGREIELPRSPLAEELVRQLRAMKGTYKASGHVRMEAKGAASDDLALALALALLALDLVAKKTC